jgi:NCS1 family nucleobase:cation symporter-1
MYLGFNATGAILSGQAVAQLAGVTNSTGILIFAGLTMLMTIMGYRFIHLAGRAASVVGVVAFCYLFARLTLDNDIGKLLAIRHFEWGSFLLAVSLSASWQIAYGPYVADYSRYLPSNTSSSKTILAVGLGSVIGAQTSMVLGVFAAALAGSSFAGHEVSVIVGLSSTGLAAALIYFSIAFGKLTISTLNAYGSFMCAATVISGFRGDVVITQAQRIGFVLCIVGASTAVALIGEDSFIGTFKSFILFLLAFFTPWSAINLVDFYFVNKGRYNLNALFDPNGQYGRWNAVGISTYVFGVLIQMPFIATSLYTGPLVERLGGVDISWIIGLIIPGLAYYILARKVVAAVPASVR